jgi:hypothetical protein
MKIVTRSLTVPRLIRMLAKSPVVGKTPWQQEGDTVGIGNDFFSDQIATTLICALPPNFMLQLYANCTFNLHQSVIPPVSFAK